MTARSATMTCEPLPVTLRVSTNRGWGWASTISPVGGLLNFRGCKLPSGASSVDETGVCRSGGLCMSSVGWRRFAEHAARGRGAARRRRSAKGRRRWAPRRLTVLRWRRPALAGAQVGTWDQLVDEGPTGSHSFAVYTPPGLRSGTAVPLVVVLHLSLIHISEPTRPY